MNTSSKKNMPASVHQKLLNISRKNKEDFNRLCIRYAAERLLYRLSVSEYADKFVLKGAMLFSLWSKAPQRYTRDIDLLSYYAPVMELLEKMFITISKQSVPDDGLKYDTENIEINQIREDTIHGGLRIRMYAYLGKVKIPVQIDIGFGDVVTPEAQTINYPTLLNFPKPELKAYPPETVIAEKFHALVKLGKVNSRMNDFYDLYIMIHLYNIKDNKLSDAIQATFNQRKTELPKEIPFALTRDFASDPVKSKQWHSFIEKNSLQDAPKELNYVIRDLKNFFGNIMSY